MMDSKDCVISSSLSAAMEVSHANIQPFDLFQKIRNLK